MGTIQDPHRPIVIPQVNPAKPPKRALQADGDSSQKESERYARPGSSAAGGPLYQRLDAKRRKTDEERDQEGEDGDGEVEEENVRRSVHAPPIRHSIMRKVCRLVTPSTLVIPPC